MTVRDGHVLITGSSSGIGRSIAIRLSRSHDVIVHGRDHGRIDETLAMCEPGDHRSWTFDLSDVSNVKAALAGFLVSDPTTVTGFVHCAGAAHVSAARLLNIDALHESMNVNALAALEIVSLLLRKPVNDGHLKNVVFISSIWGQSGAKGHVAYSASKGAIDAAMRSLAIELAPKVRFNSLALGAIETPMASKSLADPRIRSNLEASYPLGLGDPSDAASACAFLMSDDARWITGQVIVVDGGRMMNMSNNR